MKIFWIKKVTNENALRKAQMERQVMKQIVKRQCGFLGQVLRRHQIPSGTMEGRRKER